MGTGNLWRFPRIAAQNGGEEGAGAFLIAWVCFLFLWSIPLIIVEYAMGRKSKKGVIGSFLKLVGDRFAWMGGFIGFVGTAIMFYYSVVADNHQVCRPHRGGNPADLVDVSECVG